MSVFQGLLVNSRPCYGQWQLKKFMSTPIWKVADMHNWNCLHVGDINSKMHKYYNLQAGPVPALADG